MGRIELDFGADSRPVILSLCPEQSDNEHGLYFDFYVERLSQYLNATEGEIRTILPAEPTRFVPWAGGPPKLRGYLKEVSEIQRLLVGLKEFKRE